MKTLKFGFTLIELLVVIAIIGILATIVLTNVQGVRERARDYRRKSDLNSIAESLRLFYTDFKAFPTSSGNNIVGCNATTYGSLETCSWGEDFGNATTVYMNLLPMDPQSSTAAPIKYQYELISSDKYIIVTKLENKSDTDAANSRARCSAAYGSFLGTKDTTIPNKDYVVCSE